MKWAWKVGTFFGIPVYIHATFVLVIVWVVLVHGSGPEGGAAIPAGLVLTALIFLCVVLHEFGHALAARRFGIRTLDITLLPIGGLARIEKMPENPLQELWVAAAGPLVNVVIAGLLFLILFLTGTWQPVENLTVGGGPLLERLAAVNVFLVAFNLLPAFPMDGGRILRALLATRLRRVQATQIAAGVGQGMALLFGLLGLFTNPFLILIALFVWIGAAQEAAAVEFADVFRGIPVDRVMIRQFQTVRPEDRLEDVAHLLLAGYQQDFPVSDQGRLVGFLTRQDLVSALASHDRSTRVFQVMHSDYPVIGPEELLETVLPRIRGWSAVPVIRRGDLAGLFTTENLHEYLLMRSALASRGENSSFLLDTPSRTIPAP